MFKIRFKQFFSLLIFCGLFIPEIALCMQSDQKTRATQAAEEQEPDSQARAILLGLDDQKQVKALEQKLADPAEAVARSNEAAVVKIQSHMADLTIAQMIQREESAQRASDLKKRTEKAQKKADELRRSANRWSWFLGILMVVTSYVLYKYSNSGAQA